MQPAFRQAGFQGEILWELDIADKQLSALAQAIPAGNTWRPDEKARSVSEVLIHVATGNFMLLDTSGITVPIDLYPNGSAGGGDSLTNTARDARKLALVRRVDSGKPRTL